MLDKCLNRFKLSSSIFYEKNVGPTLSNIARKRIQHFLSNMLNNVCRLLNSHGSTVCHTVSLFFSRSHGRFFISYGFTNFEQIFFQAYSFLKKQTHAAHSNANKERFSSMINKSKTRIRSYLSLI